MTKITPELENRTEDENKQTINCLMNLYDLMLQEYSKLIQNIGQDDNVKNDKDNEKKEKQKNSDVVTEFKAFATLADTLMKRWNIMHRGYDTNARIAAADAKTGQQACKAVPVEARKGATVALHPDMRSAVETLPKRETDEPDKSGTIPLPLNRVEPNDSKDSS